MLELGSSGSVRGVSSNGHPAILRFMHRNRKLEKIELFRCKFLMHNESMIYGYALFAAHIWIEMISIISRRLVAQARAQQGI